MHLRGVRIRNPLSVLVQVEDVRWDLQRWKWVHAAQSAVLEQGPDALADLLRFRVNRELPEKPTRARGSLQTEERPRRQANACCPTQTIMTEGGRKCVRTGVRH